MTYAPGTSRSNRGRRQFIVLRQLCRKEEPLRTMLHARKEQLDARGEFGLLEEVIQPYTIKSLHLLHRGQGRRRAGRKIGWLDNCKAIKRRLVCSQHPKSSVCVYAWFNRRHMRTVVVLQQATL